MNNLTFNRKISILLFSFFINLILPNIATAQIDCLSVSIQNQSTGSYLDAYNFDEMTVTSDSYFWSLVSVNGLEQVFNIFHPDIGKFIDYDSGNESIDFSFNTDLDKQWRLNLLNPISNNSGLYTITNMSDPSIYLAQLGDNIVTSRNPNFPVKWILSCDNSSSDISICDRNALFDELVNKTMEREAWSPYKIGDPEVNYRAEAEALRQEFIDASTNQKLARALLKLSNLRHDSHLIISEIGSGIEYDRGDDEVVIRFAPDFSKPVHSFFVSDKAANYQVPESVAIGDELIAINGIDMIDYYNMLEPHINYSTLNKGRWEMAKVLSKYEDLFDPSLYLLGSNRPGKVGYTFKRKTDGGLYIELIDFESDETIEWQNIGAPSFPQFDIVMQRQSFDLYISQNQPVTVLINWLDLDDDLDSDIEDLMNYASVNGYLNNDVILYAPFCEGGLGSPKVVRLFADLPFKTTFGNVRNSNITKYFANSRSSDVRDWIYNAVVNDWDYTTDEPFKLRYFPEGSDGIMDPAPVRFTGNKVAVFSSLTGSNVDQMASMIIDNQLMPTIGYPTGGYSNTWEYEQYIRCPGNNKIILEYMWNIGHTIRPNGEILEGNPPIPDQIVELTNENYLTYWDDLISLAKDLLDNNTLSTDIALQTDFKVYPNPATDQLNIEFARQHNFGFSLYHVDGQLIESQSNKHLINLSGLSNGIYILELYDLDTGEKITRKIMKVD